jgi:hypothetical protein
MRHLVGVRFHKGGAVGTRNVITIGAECCEPRIPSQNPRRGRVHCRAAMRHARVAGRDPLPLALATRKEAVGRRLLAQLGMSLAPRWVTLGYADATRDRTGLPDNWGREFACFDWLTSCWESAVGT